MAHASNPSGAPGASGRPAPDRMAALLKLLDADPNDTFCLYGVAQEHVRRGDHVQAIAWFDRTIAIDRNHAYAWFHKAKTQDAAGDRAAARETLREGLAAARRAGDAKAASEIEGYLDEMAHGTGHAFGGGAARAPSAGGRP
ncbi:MAG: hypothetical protein U0575_12120 [Phycisphaerales bacterium]